MRSLITGIVIIVVIAFAGFFYRNVTERFPAQPVASSTTASEACTAEAKICPDGSAVARTGPGCSFADCSLPNEELSTASTTIGFVLPAGYVKVVRDASNQPTLATFQKPAVTANTNHSLAVTAYDIGAGDTAHSILLSNTTYDPSGLQATSTDSFKTVMAGKNTFYVVDIGRFEGQVETLYYLVTDTALYRFDLIERGVTNWSDPDLNVSALPEHRAITELLSTVQVSRK